MSQPLFYQKTLVIKADLDKVWDALTNPEITRQYMYGCEVITDWKPGSTVIWRGAADGVDYVIGHVVRYEPQSVLALTTFDPNAGYANVPENYITGEYQLSYANGETTVHIRQGDFSKAENGQKRFEEAGGGWDMAMGQMKAILEG